MPEIVSLLLTQGALGVLAAVFLVLYLQERKRNNELQITLQNQREEYTKKVDTVRVSQLEREREIAKTLDEYGRSVVLAVDQTAMIAQEIRRFASHGRQRN